MNRKQIQKEFNKQSKIFSNKVHSLIANDLGIKKLYTESNLWCEIVEIDMRFDESITISSSTFKYKLSLKGHETIDYHFTLEVNNAPEYKSIRKSDIEKHSTDFRGRIETTNNLLKSIMGVKKEILKEFEKLVNHKYDFKKESALI